MNILHTETLKGWGGQQNKVFKEMRNTKKLGHNVFLFCNPNSQIASLAKQEGIIVFEVEMNKRNYFKTIPALVKVINENKIDFVVTHSSTDGWVGSLAVKFSKKRPVIARERHNSYPIKGLASKFLHRSLCDFIITVSKNVGNFVQETVNIEKENIFILHNYVDIEKFESTNSTLRDELNIPESATVLGIFTSLRKDKGLLDFFEVTKELLKKYDDLYVVYGGKYGEPEREYIDKFYKENNFDMERIKWTGYRTDANNVMKGFDLYLFPSHSEGMPNVVLEAMASSLPVVVYDIEPMNVLVKNGINGNTAKFLDTKDLTIKTDSLIGDKIYLKELGKNGFEFVKQEFSYDTFVNNIERLIQKVEKYDKHR